MLGSTVLEVAVGICFSFVLVSTLCTAVREGIEGWRKSRAAYLERGIRELLHDPKAEGLVPALFRHPLIYGLFLGEYPTTAHSSASIFAKGRGLPSYIPARSFALALMDIAARGADMNEATSDPDAPPLSAAAIRANLVNLSNPAVQRVMMTALDQAGGDLERVRTSLEAWFDSAMERVSGWYRRSTQWVILMIAIVITAGLNVDTIGIAKFLYQNDIARSTMVAHADSAATDPEYLKQDYQQLKAEIDKLALPVGWTGKEIEEGPRAWSLRIAGWLLSILAATLGAPFWFDVLNKIMVVRSTVKPNEKSGPEASEDRQLRRPPMAAPAPQLPSPAGGGNGGQHTPAFGRGGTLLGWTAHDDDSHLDACDVPMDSDTPDEDLPPAFGGVG